MNERVLPSDPLPSRSARPHLGLRLGAVAAWLVTRGVVVWLFLDRHSWVTGDLGYFADSLEAVPDAGLAHVLVEYPLPGVLVIALPWLLVELAGAAGAYAETVLAFSVLADAAFLVLLMWRADRPRAAVAVWVLAVPLLGATAYARFDLVPGVLAGASLLLLWRHPRTAAAAGALATGFKLWPALVLPALAAPAASRRTVVRIVVVLGAVLAGTSLALAGWGRLVSPLTWQADRGLQIESVAATPAMLRWAATPDRYELTFSEHNAFEITGPGTEVLVRMSEVGSLLLVPVLLAMWLLAWRRGREVPAETVAWLALAAVGAFVVTSKVLSPQYLLWLLPLAAAATAVAGARALRAWAGLLLVATATTQVVFPELYGYLVAHGEHTGAAVLVLAARNTLLLGLTAWAMVRAAHGLEERGALSGASRSSANHPVRRGASPAASGDGPPTRR